MLVLKTDAEVPGEIKNKLREDIKARTGEECLILDIGFDLKRIKVKKEQPLWRRLFWRS